DRRRVPRANGELGLEETGKGARSRVRGWRRRRGKTLRPRGARAATPFDISSGRRAIDPWPYLARGLRDLRRPTASRARPAIPAACRDGGGRRAVRRPGAHVGPERL